MTLRARRAMLTRKSRSARTPDRSRGWRWGRLTLEVSLSQSRSLLVARQRQACGLMVVPDSGMRCRENPTMRWSPDAMLHGLEAMTCTSGYAPMQGPMAAACCGTPAPRRPVSRPCPRHRTLYSYPPRRRRRRR